jgi:tetratricopeptide (TPR) repeat protein
VEILQASVEGEPENWSLRRELAEAMLEAGDREGGIRELESAMAGAERTGDLDLASSLAEEIARIEPEAVRHHQKRVEYAFRTNDRPRLIEAYLALGDALLTSEQADKARAIYQRVIDLAPDEVRAQAALESLGAPEPEPAPPPRASGQRKTTAVQSMPEPAAPAAAASNDFVNLGDWLRDDDGPKDTRMVVAEQEPTGDEDADFADMLRKFKQGVAENVDAEDYQSHYDLAIAFKEMGLLDEAIAEFQKALGSPANRLPTYEALGQCFLEKAQPKLASSILSRALNEKASEDQLVGVLYLLGKAAEEQGNAADALTYYQRVFVLDIQFRDIADRMNEVERAAR